MCVCVTNISNNTKFEYHYDFILCLRFLKQSNVILNV